MTLIVKALAAGAIGLALGVAASGSILADPPFGAVTIGAWRVAATAGSLDADPYTRAALARSGEIPLALGEGLQTGRARRQRRAAARSRAASIASGRARRRRATGR